MSFESAIVITLKNEGGYQCYPNDRGNWTGGEVGQGELKGTKYGLSARIYPTLDIKNLTEDEARAIYRRDVWDRYGLDRVPERTGEKLFDSMVLLGPDAATVCLQRAVRANKLSIHEDGLFGPQTVALVNQLPDQVLIPAFREALAGHHREVAERNPSDRRFLSDWLERAYQ